jgi:DNA-binding NarL/FixJ family response regulator
MPQPLSLQNLMHLAAMCNEFDGNAAAFGKVLKQCVEPLQCLHAAIFCVVTRQPLVNWLEVETNCLAFATRFDWHRWYSASSAADSISVIRNAHPTDHSDMTREVATHRDARLTIVYRQHDATRLREIRLTFAVVRDSCDESDAQLLVHLIAPQLHTALLRIERAQRRGSQSSLSKAELQVAGGVLRGWSNKEIARVLGKSDATVRNQLHSLFRKLQVRRRSAAIDLLRRLDYRGDSLDHLCVANSTSSHRHRDDPSLAPSTRIVSVA